MKKQTIEVKQIDWFDDHFYKIRYINEAKVEIEDYYPSVTTKLEALPKPFIAKWRGDIGNREADLRMNEAADRGSRIHYGWQVFTTGGAVIYQPEKTPLYTREELEEIYKFHNNNVTILYKQDEMYDIMKLQRVWNELKPQDPMSEFVVYNIEHRDAGTVDNAFTIAEGNYMIGGAKPTKIKGGRYIHDLKTGKTVDKSALMQCAAYMVAAESMGDEPYAGLFISHTQAQTRSGIDGYKAIIVEREEALEYYQDYRDIAKVWERNFGDRKPVIRQIPGMISLSM